MICDSDVPCPLARLRFARVVHVVVLAATEAEVTHGQGRRLVGAISLELALLDPQVARELGILGVSNPAVRASPDSS